ncbi:MAG: PKD domain-containing protein, partial [Candidatus Marinimicrobia bacterium]|nr:PKD domain-containing protein [Candidatus Neomarinimicrobiota bacterium]
LTVVFTDVSTVENTTITSWLWDFGDAMTSTEPNPTHIYTIAGVYTVSLTVSDGTIESTETKVDYIVAVNNPPIAADIQKITDEDIFVVIILSGSDADGDALTFEVVDSPTSGVLTGDASDLVYTPVENYFGDDSFTYKVNDGTDDSNIATVSITVNAVNDSPIIEMISDTSFVAGLELKIGLIANDIDEDPLTFSAETDNEDIFATISVDTLVLSANVDFAGESNITVFVSDSELSDSTVFKVTVTQPTSLDEITQIPTEFGLSQNYPNPFNPTTAINYQLPIMSNVQLAIYNVQGRLIETLVNELQDAGFYSVEWIAGDVSSGVYFYRISVETNGHFSFQETKKMVLLR